ncbi:MAG TPA: 3-methyl-2-oxobutanoate hydroxymethyltransferase [Candidatus Alectryocaccobium stercorigallinarum]|nr:3-methyl-2-oxobutanoate hydroxymethyltransferase [Candidatus Alectryocaccobium stercorigallinarum]
MKKNSVLTFKKAKEEGTKLTMLTAYDYTTAKLIDEAGVNCILIGDSLGNVMLGYEDTLSVTVDDMIHHCAAVARAAKNALVLCDMPFMSYEVSVEEALKNAGRIMKEGRANAVKLEGGAEYAPQIRAMVNAGIPVCGHLGLTPQSVNVFGGNKVQGKSLEAAKKLMSDAKALEEAGAFAVVLECVPAALAAEVTKELNIPTIGIGAGAQCDGQVLVYQDMLAMSGFCAKFCKQYAQIGQMMSEAFKNYIKEVQDGAFPAGENTFSIDKDIIDKLY